MKFHVDSWDPTYGSSVESAEDSVVQNSTARVDVDVEVNGARWAPIDPTPVTEPGALLFIDGVRRTEARIWIAQDPVLDEGTGEVLGEESVMALCASYAAGVVCCCPNGRAHLIPPYIRRGLFTTATNPTDVVTTAGTYTVNVTANDPEQNLAALLSAALQRNLAELEIIVAANARDALVGHGVEEGTDLIVIDGPLRGRTHLPRALGFIKSHRSYYLPGELNAMVSRLKAGQRTPVFLMGTSWDRYAWYLRLPCAPGGSPWNGIVRLECGPDMRASDAAELANLSQALLPRYASKEFKDPRAPQNLVPVAGLENELRRRLGNVALMTRALRVAAASA